MFAYGKKYREPLFTVIVLGEPNKDTVSKLHYILRTRGLNGLRVYIVKDSSSSRFLESLRDFIFSNHTYTLEVFTAEYEQLREIYEKEGDRIVSILVSDSNLVQYVPSILRNKLEAL
ncbi:MAG: hypothetical protein QXE10_07070 [Desulfurococcaceae archaeon]